MTFGEDWGSSVEESQEIIGARRLTQLEDNVNSLDVTLTVDDLSKLDALTKPGFGFPQSVQPMFPAMQNGGTRVNGVQMPLPSSSCRSARLRTDR